MKIKTLASLCAGAVLAGCLSGCVQDKYVVDETEKPVLVSDSGEFYKNTLGEDSGLYQSIRKHLAKSTGSVY